MYMPDEEERHESKELLRVQFDKQGHLILVFADAQVCVTEVARFRAFLESPRIEYYALSLDDYVLRRKEQGITFAIPGDAYFLGEEDISRIRMVLQQAVREALGETN
jgi:hypothetical protein